MGLVDRFLNFINFNDDDDDDDEYDSFDDYDSDFSDDDDDDEKEHRSFFSGRKKKEEKKETRDTKPSDTGRIVPMRPRQGNVKMEVCIIKPTSMEDAREITETLLSGRSIILNMEGLNVDIAQRIIDFSGGSCFALGGNLQKVSGSIFVITPSQVDISGDIQSFIGSVESSVHLEDS